MRTLLGLLLVLVFCSAVLADESHHQGTERIRRAVQTFKDTILNRPPFDRYQISVDFTTLQAQRVYHDDIVLTHDETWQSWCLDVTVGVNFPPEIRQHLPSTFWEFRVFVNPRRDLPSSSSSYEDSSSNNEICPTMALVCPDGSMASLTQDCIFVCGAQPLGGLSFQQVEQIETDILVAYDYEFDANIDTLGNQNLQNIHLTKHETLSDYCIVVTLTNNDNSLYPGVYNGVRVFYTVEVCSSKVCPDGSNVGCDDECPPEHISQGSVNLFVPISAIIFVIALSTCCCYLKGRKCQKATTITTTPSKAQFTKLESQELPQEPMYPAEQFEYFQNQEPDTEVPPPVPPMMSPQMFPMMHMMHPQMGMMAVPMPMLPPSPHMGFPPMPPMPPGMMMPNGAFPVMIQGPNGMWFAAPPHPEDA